MIYFSHRNKYRIEHSGYKDASPALRERLLSVMKKYVRGGESLDPYLNFFVEYEEFAGEVQKHILKIDPWKIVNSAPFHEVFTVVEIYAALAFCLDGERNVEIIVALQEAFSLSGSVYRINADGKVVLSLNEDLAKQVKAAGKVLEPYADAHKTFFEAVGNLVGRKTKPGDVVRDIFVAAERYLKIITKEARYSNAVKKLASVGAINNEQKAVMEKLYAFRSNTHGTAHAGSSPEADEKQALWFLDTMSAQLRHIDIQAKEKKV